MIRAILATAFVLTAIHVNGQSKPRASTPEPQLRLFTVADSIEMSHFVDPPERGLDPLNVSPDRSRMIVLMERGILASDLREFALLVYDLRNLSSPPKRVVTFNSSSNRPGIDHVKWVNNDDISFVAENPGQLPQVYFLSLKTGKSKQLTSESGGVNSYDISSNSKTLVYYGLWTDEEATRYKDRYGFAVTDEDLHDLVDGGWRERRSIYVMYVKDLNSGKTRRVDAAPVYGYGDSEVWASPDGRYAIAREGILSPLKSIWESYEDNDVSTPIRARLGQSFAIREGFPRQMMLVDTSTAKMQPLLDAPATGLPTVAWSKDSRSAVVCGVLLPLDTQDADELARRRKYPVLAEVEVPSLKYRRITDIPPKAVWQVRQGESPSTVLVAGVEPQKDNVFRRIPTIQYRREGSGVWKNSGEYRESFAGSDIVLSESLESRPKLVKVDTVSHQETVILDPNPQFDHFRFGKVETVHWTGKKGEALTGWLIYPTDFAPGKRYPLVIQGYKFSPDRFLLDGPMNTAFAAQELANKGIAVLQMQESSLLEPSEWSPEYTQVEISQVESAIDYLDSMGVIDREKVGLIGFSKTGHQVLYCLAFSRYHFSAATVAEGTAGGYWDYVLAGNSAFGDWVWDQFYQGNPWRSNWQMWMKNSLTFNYYDIHTPLRLESDRNDPHDGGGSAVLDEWEPFVALKRLNRPVELIFVPHGAHPVRKPWDRLASQQGDVDWFVFWLKGEEDPDPDKSKQYARWRELRRLQEREPPAIGR